MSEIVCMRGLPGSGKSTHAKALLGSGSEYVRVNRDDLRASLFDGSGILDKWQENLITRVQTETAHRALRVGTSVVVDDMNLRPQYLRKWADMADEFGAEFRTWEVSTPVDVCVARDSARDRSVGEEVIRDIAKKFLRNDEFIPFVHTPKTKPEPVEWDASLPSCVLVDIDGTVALMGDRKPYDWGRVGEDEVNLPVAQLVRLLAHYGENIIFLSGRDGSCYRETAKWVGRHVTYNYRDLLMRMEGDNRKDSIVKRELFDQHIRGKYYVEFVLDDRDQVVEMWRSLGLTCLQVAPGEF